MIKIFLLNFSMNIETDGYKAKTSSNKNHSYDNKNLDINYKYSYDKSIFI